MQIRLLGPFELELDGGRPAVVGSAKERGLLAVVATHANEALSEGPPEFEALKKIDKARWHAGQPHILENVEVPAGLLGG